MTIETEHAEQTDQHVEPSKRLRVALLYGGRSSEHSISCATAGSVLSHLDPERFDVVQIGITKTGAMTLQGTDPAALTLAAMPTVHDNGTRVHLPIEAGDRQLRLVENDEVREIGEVDIVFPILHGPFGEDGTIQGLIELSGLPYVGNGVLGSAVANDKHFTKTVLAHSGIPVVPWVLATKAEWQADPDSIRHRLGDLTLPLFVKPARAGSSVGVSRVQSLLELDKAMETALREDSRVLIEAGVAGREIEIAVLGGRDGSMPRAALPGEILLQPGEFYDFEAKYVDPDRATVVCPADVDERLTETLQSVAVRAFEAIDGAGLARVDFFVSEAHGVLVNEINTMPGFTTISMFPQAWAASGIAYGDLITELIELGLAESR